MLVQKRSTLKLTDRILIQSLVLNPDKEAPDQVRGSRSPASAKACPAVGPTEAELPHGRTSASSLEPLSFVLETGSRGMMEYLSSGPAYTRKLLPFANPLDAPNQFDILGKNLILDFCVHGRNPGGGILGLMSVQKVNDSEWERKETPMDQEAENRCVVRVIKRQTSWL